MRIVSTTLCGPGSEEILGDALRSVAGWVDSSIIIWTGPPTEEQGAFTRISDDIAARFHDWPDHWGFEWRSWTWRNDFAAARNAALDFAAEFAADVAVTLDADERLELRGEDVGATLARSTAGCISAMASDGSYGKPRAFRLPSPIRWRGRTHESYAAHEDPRGHETFASLRFSELHKTPEQLRAKFERDAQILTEDTLRNPSDARAFYYLGDALDGLSRYEDALVAFRASAALRGWDEEGAWARYRGAALLTERLGRHLEAVDECAAGLALHAGIAELCWLAGLAAYRAGRNEQALYWSSLAEVHGEHGDRRALKKRIGFRYPHGLGPGPADITRHALLAMGEAPRR